MKKNPYQSSHKWLILISLSFLLSGCATGNPPTAAAPVTPPVVTTKTLSIRLNLLGNPFSTVTRTPGAGCPSQSQITFYPHYFIAVNTSSQQIAQIDFGSDGLPPSTWTDYLRYSEGTFKRNHRIASQGQGQQFTGERQVSNGSVSGQTILFNITIPDNESVVGWGDPSQYFITAVTYLTTSNNSSLMRIDSLGPPITAGFSPENMLFNSSISASNSLTDSGGTGDVVKYPIELDACGFTATDYNSLDINSIQVTLSQ